MPVPTYGVAYSQQLLVTGGSGNYTSWTTPLATSPLPPGLTLNATTGLITGTPAATGSFTTLLQVSDDAGNVHQQNISFNVASPTGTTLNFGLGANQTIVGGATATLNLNPSGGTGGPYTITLMDPLPAGCTLMTGNQVLANAFGNYFIYCGAQVTGVFNFTVKVTDANGNVGARRYTLNIAPVASIDFNPLTPGSDRDSVLRAPAHLEQQRDYRMGGQPRLRHASRSDTVEQRRHSGYANRRRHFYFFAERRRLA